ncbi:hypothetical protein MMC22_005087 [Lobaria immixta]|nr:hypothetical protein [Lobaria immixta]
MEPETNPNSMLSASNTSEHMASNIVDQPKENSNTGHAMSHQDPDNPHNWPLYRRVYASAVSYAFGFVVAFGITSYTAGIPGLMNEFNVSMTVAILGFSLNLLGIAFAPIMTPHITERLGRSPVYLASLPLFSLFILGASRSHSYSSLAFCRFFAGFFGGPCFVLIEGTFADCWRAHTTVTYYSVLSLSSYVGAACGPLIGGYVFASTDWRWTQYVTLMLALAAFLLGIGLPETYNRSILRRRAGRLGLPPPKLLSAQSGVTLRDMVQVTFLTPLKMLFTEPIVALISIYVAFNFAVLFQWFIAVPAVLHLVYSFTVQQQGLAFIAAIVGSVLAAATSISIDKITYLRLSKNSPGGMVDIEYRLLPAMIGGLFMTASLFWVGWTANPTISFASPILGTMLYVWGSMCALVS